MFVNAELHTLATDATPDFVYKTGSDAGTPPYCRSVAHLLTRRHVWYVEWLVDHCACLSKLCCVANKLPFCSSHYAQWCHSAISVTADASAVNMHFICESYVSHSPFRLVVALLVRSALTFDLAGNKSEEVLCHVIAGASWPSSGMPMSCSEGIQT